MHRIRQLYHFTDVRNLPSIRARGRGGLWSLHKLVEEGVEIAAPGGNQLSHDLDDALGLDRYVHLSLAPRPPMIKVVRDEGRIDVIRVLCIDRTVLDLEGVRYTSAVANRNGVELIPVTEAAETGLIDFEVLYERLEWRDPEVNARRQAAEKCEILVPDAVPLAYIKNMPRE